MTTSKQGFTKGFNEREAFEAWIAGHAEHLASYYFDKNDHGGYVSAVAQARWEAWQARAALSRATGEGV
jgi:uncharacterized alpha-E superfamily protein